MEMEITLCLSIIKKDNFELAVQKATELGVTTIIPILSSRSEKKNLSFDRLEKIAIESAEQCGRGDVPHIMPIVTLEQALAKVHDKQLLIMLDLGTKSLVNEKQALLDSKNISEITLFIGPEGGWSDEDHELMNNRGVKKYSLGNTVLRAETAAIVAVSLFTL
jgi:16S rRNA (uracil1498-N3)-methyltransferase